VCRLKPDTSSSSSPRSAQSRPLHPPPRGHCCSPDRGQPSAQKYSCSCEWLKSIPVMTCAAFSHSSNLQWGNSSFLLEPGPGRLLATLAGRRQRSAQQGVVYAEITLSIALCSFPQSKCPAIFALSRSVRSKRPPPTPDPPPQVQFIFDAVRQFGSGSSRGKLPNSARSSKNHCVVAFGLGGDELRLFPFLISRRVYKFAAEPGLHLLAHPDNRRPRRSRKPRHSPRRSHRPRAIASILSSALREHPRHPRTLPANLLVCRNSARLGIGMEGVSVALSVPYFWKNHGRGPGYASFDCEGRKRNPPQTEPVVEILANLFSAE